MKLYLLFLTVAALTVASPGPGVVMTLSNALRLGWRGAFGGILGVACGALVVAALSATSLGLLLAGSALAFTVVKGLGAAYLIYLGVRLWRAEPLHLLAAPARGTGFGRLFLEGLLLQFTNPKAVFFFLSVLPPFIDPAEAFGPQFLRLVLSYGLLVVLIHSAYARFAQQARGWLVSERGGRLMNRSAGAVFIGFGVALATARR